jgi:hypothetical protein
MPNAAARAVRSARIGIDHDTAAFAVESIRRWWQELGKTRYPNANAS